MLNDSHYSFKANLLLIRNYKTSRAAHHRLELIIKKKCERAKTTDYGLQPLDNTVLRIAIVKELYWLL